MKGLIDRIHEAHKILHELYAKYYSNREELNINDELNSVFSIMQQLTKISEDVSNKIKDT